MDQPIKHQETMKVRYILNEDMKYTVMKKGTPYKEKRKYCLFMANANSIVIKIDAETPIEQLGGLAIMFRIVICSV